MHHTCGPAQPLWYTDDLRAADAVLEGLHWRCPRHGVTDDALLLGSVAYCPAEGCIERALLVQTSWEVPGQWRTRRARVALAPPRRRDGRAQRGRSRFLRALKDALEAAAGRELDVSTLWSEVRERTGVSIPRTHLKEYLYRLLRRGAVRHPTRSTWSIA